MTTRQTAIALLIKQANIGDEDKRLASLLVEELFEMLNNVGSIARSLEVLSQK